MFQRGCEGLSEKRIKKSKLIMINLFENSSIFIKIYLPRVQEPHPDNLNPVYIGKANENILQHRELLVYFIKLALSEQPSPQPTLICYFTWLEIILY